MAIAEYFTVAAVAGLFGDCLKNAVGNALTDGGYTLAGIGGRQIARHTAHWSLPENEHVAKALRRAQFNALNHLLNDFADWIETSQIHALDEAGEKFLKAARRFGRDGRASADRAPDRGASDVAAVMEATLDKVLAGRTQPGSRGAALIAHAENAMLEELRSGVMLPSVEAMPGVFLEVFRGGYDLVEGWHARFVHYSHHELKDDADFRTMFEVTRLARLAEGVEELKTGQEAIREGVDSLNDKFDALLRDMSREKGVNPAHLKPLFDAVQQDVPAAHFESAIRAAVEALLAKAADKAQPMNDPAAVIAAIDAARACLKRLDVAGAVGVLDRAIEEQDSLRQSATHGEVRLLAEKADILSKAYRWNEALETLKRAAGLEPENAIHWFNSGDIHVHQGRLDAALADFSKGRDSAGQAGNDRDLSVGLNRIGDVRVAQGDLAGALRAYGDGLAIAEKLASGDPSNSEWQRDLWVSLNKIGEVRVAQGDLAEALRGFEDGLAIAVKLASGDPSNSEWQRDLSVSHNKIGNVRVAQGDLDGALAAYGDGLAIAQRLASGDPSNSGWQRDLSVSHNKIGDVRVAQGDLAGALRAYEEGLAIREKLASGDPSNSQWQRDLIVSHVKLAEAGGDAVKHYGEALAIANRLKAEGRLAPVDAFIPGMLEERLKAARGG